MDRNLLLSMFLIIFLSAPCYSQEATDSSVLWVVEMEDGNEFTGSILSEDDSSVRFYTGNYGELVLPRDQIKELQQVRVSSLMEGEYWFENPHDTRYFFGPSGYGNAKGTGYYQNTLVLFNQVNYGLTDHLSLGAGMMPLFLFAGAPSPVWAIPKLSIPLKQEMINLSAGGLFLHILGEGQSLGILFGALSIGDRNHNLTLGTGWGFESYEGDFSWAATPTLMLSGMTRVGRKGYLVSENYLIGIDGDQLAILSLGGRSVQKRLAIDYGLFFPVFTSGYEFIAIPWLGITLPFGKAQDK